MASFTDLSQLLHSEATNFSAYPCRFFFDELLPNRWIGQRGFIEYPLHSPDLTLLDFSMGLPKRQSLATKPAIVANLREAIEYECAQIPTKLLHDVSDSIAWCCQQCLDQNGGQREQTVKITINCCL